MENETLIEVFDVVSEISSDGIGGLVPVSRATLDAVTEGDDDPRFATFVIESGWSKSRRYWGADLFADVAEQINSNSEPLVGYMGHIRPDDDPYTFPEIQLQWVGSKLIQSGDTAKLAVKAYVLPLTKARDYMKRGLCRTVSWRGKVAQEPFEKGVRIKKFLIESIDLARPRAAGMSAHMVGALTSEMSENGGNDVKPEEIAALQENELRAHAPTLVAQIEANARGTLETKVSEMETEVAEIKPLLNSIPDLRKLLGLGNDVEPLEVLKAAISHLKQAGQSVKDALLNSVLDKKLKGEDKTGEGALLRRLVASEMRERDYSLTGDQTKDETTVSEMVNEIIDGDEKFKAIVSEMEGAPALVQNAGDDRGRGAKRELKPGYESSTMRVRSVSR
jgi:hypothetical protein